MVTAQKAQRASVRRERVDCTRIEGVAVGLTSAADASEGGSWVVEVGQESGAKWVEHAM